MDELLQALEKLNSELEQDGIVLNLNVIGGFSLYLQNLEIEVRQSHDIDSANKLTDEVKARVMRIGQELNIDLRWLNDDVLSLLDEFEAAGIDLAQLKFSPNKRIDFSNIHLNTVDISDFLKLKLFSIFLEVYDFLQYNKSFEREQDLQDIKALSGIVDRDLPAMLNVITSYVQDPRVRDLTQLLLDVYLTTTLSNVQINDFLKDNRMLSR